MFELLSRVTVNMISDFSPHSLADLTWAFAASKPPSAAAVLQAAAPAAAACLARFSCGMLSDLLWSYGSVGVRDEELLNAAAEVGLVGTSVDLDKWSIVIKQCYKQCLT